MFISAVEAVTPSNIFNSIADEVTAFLKCQRRDLMSLKQFPTIEKIFRK